MKTACWIVAALLTTPLYPQVTNGRALALQLTSQGSAEQDGGRIAEAERSYAGAMRADPTFVEPVNQLASLYFETQQYSKAEKLTLKAMSMVEGEGRARALAKLTGNLGSVYEAEQRYYEAERLDLKALQLFEKAGGAKSPDAGYVLHNLASLRMAAGQPRDAAVYMQSALDVWQGALGERNGVFAQGLAHLAHIDEALGRSDEAEALWKRALSIARDSLGPTHPTYGRLLRAYAESLEKQRRRSEARRVREQANAISNVRTGYTVDYRTLR